MRGEMTKVKLLRGIVEM
jgi:hypothetical protein